MRLSEWSTGFLPEPEQFDFVREALRAATMPFRIERPGTDAGERFTCAMRTDQFADGGAYGISSRTDWLIGLREREEVARSKGDFIWVWRSMSRNARMRVGGRDYAINPGDLIFGNTGTLIDDAQGNRIDYTLWLFAREMFGGDDAFCRGEPSGVIAASTPSGALASSYVAHLLPVLDSLDPAAQAALVGNLGALIGLAHQASAPAREQAAAALSDARLRRLYRYLDRHHSDPTLTPRSVAQSNGLSVRTVHALFEPTGGSFSRYITGRRLETAHALLSEKDGRTVADIAYASGFDSMATFYRAFRDRYGHSPGDLRRS